MTTYGILTKSEIDTAFYRTNYGGTDPLEVLKTGLLKVACGYHNGHTTESILQELNLTTRKGKLTRKGQQYLYAAFQEHLKH